MTHGVQDTRKVHVGLQRVIRSIAAAMGVGAMVTMGTGEARPADVSLSPDHWLSDYTPLLQAQDIDRTEAGVASGTHGAVTVAYNGLAGRAGLEALKQGGNAMDAALTAALTQVALTAGAPISYFGILSLSTTMPGRTRSTR